jgi:RND superfamily putative drug exporter
MVDRTLASFAVNLTRGGNAGQIVVFPTQAANTDATRQLGEDLKVRAAQLARVTGTDVAVGGPAGDLGDLTSRANQRLPLVVVALAAAMALALTIMLRALAFSLVAVGFDLLVALATFGVMSLLFNGADPLLGGPGYLDPMSIIGIFAAIFGITSTYELMLLTRMREHFVASGDAPAALLYGLRRTAAVATGTAAVMAAAALPFAFSDLINVRQFGIGIAVAVMLDALVVRPVLLPAAVAVLGRRAWWPTVYGLEPAAQRVPGLHPPAPGGMT